MTREYISVLAHIGYMSGSYNYNLNSQGSVRCEGMANYKTNYTVFAAHDDLGVMFIRTV